MTDDLELKLWRRLGLDKLVAEAAERADLTDAERGIVQSWRIGRPNFAHLTDAERRRLEAKISRAGRLGVDWRFLPDEE